MQALQFPMAQTHSSAPLQQELPTWHSNGDVPMRQRITGQIFDIFNKRKPGNSHKLPEFIKRVEESLYRNAKTMEEYMDSDTLEQRLQEVARKYVRTSNGQPQHSQSHMQQSMPATHAQMPSAQHGAQPQAMLPLKQETSSTHALGPHSNGLPGVTDSTNFNRGGHLMNGSSASASAPLQTSDAVNQKNPSYFNQMVPSSAMGMSASSNGGNMTANGAPVQVKREFPQGMNGNIGPAGAPGYPGQQNQGVNPGLGAGLGPSSGMVPLNHGSSHQMAAQQQNLMAQFGSQPLPSMPGGLSGSGNNSFSGTNSGPQHHSGSSEDKNSAVTKQQRWLLFLRHCAKCRQNENECTLKAQCKFGKQLWHHILHCASSSCEFPRCSNSKDLLKHHQKCQDARCPICVPVKEYVKRTRAQQQQAVVPEQGMSRMLQYGGEMVPNPVMPQHPGIIQNSTGMVPKQGMMTTQGMVPNPVSMPTTRMVPTPGMLPAPVMIPTPGLMHNPGMGQSGNIAQNQSQFSVHPQHMGMNGGMQAMPMASGQKRSHGNAFDGFSGGGSAVPTFAGGLVPGMRSSSDDPLQKKQHKSEDVLNTNTGTSLLETFDEHQIRLHIQSIQAASAAQKLQVPAGVAPSDMCRVCGLTKLTFEPPLLYCGTCGLKIKRGQVYYCTPEASSSEFKVQLCHTCFSDQKGSTITLPDATSFQKSQLEKKKNEEDLEEGWVQCDHCEGWVHQICGMFNKGRNNPDVHYMCPECLLLGLQLERRQRITVRPQSMLDAKELPKTHLSAFLEYYMGTVIEEERRGRAVKLGLEPIHVPGCEQMSVRVVNNIIKKCEVKSRFQEAFGSDYPQEFAYRQRVIVLFQTMEGVDVCLFVMYVQEYGQDCPAPNKNVVYLSYLDSVKYFRPDNIVAHGCPNPKTSLRTFVYHQLLVGYLSYVKRLGYEQMYIWACPPMAGDDYIMYCHPSSQKTPRSDRLRAWYHDMLKDAQNKGLVTYLSTLWDTFFEGGRDHRLELKDITARDIPYLEGDYWPGEAENQLSLIADGKSGKKEKGKGAAVAGSGGSKGKRYGAGTGSIDELLMSKLGEILGGNMREDFIVVHMKEVCTFCRTHVTEGYIYKHSSTSPMRMPAARTFEGVKIECGPNIPTGAFTSVNLCQKCYDEENMRFMMRDPARPLRLPATFPLAQMKPLCISPEIRMQDPDPDMECDFFETRQSFLNLCQGNNHYQFDTIRRAKHSSMMVLYHLHNPDAPTVSTSCSVCTVEIEPGTGFRCTVCQDCDICAACQQRSPHPHPVTQHVRKVDETRVRLTDKERQERHEQLQRTMQLLIHACSCANPACPSNSCRKVRQLFQHAMQCPVKVTGGCQLCKKMLCLLKLHAKSCARQDCPVPRCRELKEITRRQAARQEDQRRKMYQKMLRKQVAAQKPGY